MYEGGRQKRPADRGFTLFEVVVAMAVLGLIFSTAFGVLAAGLRAAKASTDYTQAVLLAERQIEGLLSEGVQPGFVDGTFEGGYRWTAEVSPEGPAAQELQARLFKVRVKVFWPGRRGEEKQFELVTLATVVEEVKLRKGPPPSGQR